MSLIYANMLKIILFIQIHDIKLILEKVPDLQLKKGEVKKVKNEDQY